jgi:hypothetical protein
MVSLEFFIDINASDRTMALGSTQPLTEMCTRSISWGCGRCVGLITLPPSCAVVKKSGNLNFLEPSGPLQACNGTALPLPLLHKIKTVRSIFVLFWAHGVGCYLRRKYLKSEVWHFHCNDCQSAQFVTSISQESNHYILKTDAAGRSETTRCHKAASVV